jgi:hypothetical protein
MSLPIVITKDISDDSDIIKNNDIGYVLENLTNEEYINACKKIDTLILNKKEISTKIRNIHFKYRNFNIANNIYSKIYS